MNLLDYLPSVQNFPKPGILFRDISPLLENPAAFSKSIEILNDLASRHNYTHLVGIESRGFIFGSALAHFAKKGLVLARKPNKLPLATHRESYGLEYGTDALEIQQSTLPAASRILLIDDVLATGGTFVAANKLLQNAGFHVCGAISLLEISGLGGHQLLKNNNIQFDAAVKT